MKKVGVVLLLVVLLAACSQQVIPAGPLETEATGWKRLGGDLRAGISDTIIDFRPVITLSGDKPVVAWQEWIEDDAAFDINIRVRRWNGTSWQEIGNPSDFRYEDRLSLQPSLATQKNGTTIGVSWSTSFAEIFVKTWNGKRWQQVGGMVGEGTETQLAFDNNNRPVVAYQRLLQTGELTNIYVSRWNGSSWEQLGGALDNIVTNSAFLPSLAVDALGRPVVAWEEDNDLGRQVYVKRWNGTSWQRLGDTLNVNPNVYSGSYPSLSLLFNLLPIVTWHEDYTVYVKAWTGWNWLNLGGKVTDSAVGQMVAVGPDNQPVVVLNNYAVLPDEPDSKRWTCSQFGCQWLSFGVTGMITKDLVINSKNQSFAVGIIEDFNGSLPKIFVKQYSK